MVPHRLVVVARAVFLIAAACLAGAPASASAQMREYQAKGAFLLNFARFVEWPSEVLDGAPELTVCAAAPRWMYDELQTALTGRQVGSKPVRLRLPRETDACHILFVGTSEPLTPLTRNDFTLVVSEHPDGLIQGAHINFHMQGSLIRFQIAGRSQHARFTISSRLLELSSQPK